LRGVLGGEEKVRRLVVFGVLVFLLTAPAYGDLFVQTVGDIDAMVDATFTSFDAEHNLDCYVLGEGSIEWDFTFDPGVPVDAIDAVTVTIWAWDVRWTDMEVVSIAGDEVSYVLGGLDHLYQGGLRDWHYGVTTGRSESDYGTLEPNPTTFTLTPEQASNLFSGNPSATVRIDIPAPDPSLTSDRSIAVDYATITIDYTPGAEPVHTPEPASMIMLGALGAGLAGARKLRRKK
jgi:hypothetical protein